MISLRNRINSSQELGSDLVQTSGTQVYSSTIRSALVKEGLPGQVAKKETLPKTRKHKNDLNFSQSTKSGLFNNGRMY